MASFLERLLGADPDGAMAQADVPSGDLLAHILGGLATKGANTVQSAVTAPRDAYRGDLQVFDPTTGHVSDEALARANEMAGLAMTGGLGGSGAGGSVLGAGPIFKQAHGPEGVNLGYVMREVEPRALNSFDRSLNRLRTQMMEDGAYQEADLPVRSLVATQKYVNPDYAEAAARSKGDGLDLPAVYKVDGRYLLADGHHRATAASEKSDTVRVRLYDMDAARNGKPDARQLDLPISNLGMGLNR